MPKSASPTHSPPRSPRSPAPTSPLPGRRIAVPPSPRVRRKQQEAEGPTWLWVAKIVGMGAVAAGAATATFFVLSTAAVIAWALLSLAFAVFLIINIGNYLWNMANAKFGTGLNELGKEEKGEEKKATNGLKANGKPVPVIKEPLKVD